MYVCVCGRIDKPASHPTSIHQEVKQDSTTSIDRSYGASSALAHHARMSMLLKLVQFAACYTVWSITTIQA